MNPVLALLLSNLDDAYDKRGWHGPNLRGALRGVTIADLLWRPGQGRHTIWELTAHAAYWKYAARRRMAGEKRGGFPLKGSNWFVAGPHVDERDWRELLRLLDDTHRQLRETIASLSDADLREPKKLRIAYGVAAHDTYHAGQIQLLKRLARP
jgi:hypothetical protein